MSKRIINISALLICCLFFSQCLKKAGIYGENGNGDEAQIVSVQYLKSLYGNYPLTIDQDMEMDVQVIANDRYGTFNNTLVVSDDTGGIEIKVSGSELFAEFPVGQYLKVRCKGLTIGAYGGVVQLGSRSDSPQYQTSFIPVPLIQAHLSKLNKPIDYISPIKVTIRSLAAKHVSSLVTIENVQFADEESGLAWCDPDVDTDRHLIDMQGDTLIVRTSRNAIFAKTILPQKSGQVEGILSYFNGKYQLKIYADKNLIMRSPRFTPVVR